MNSASAAPMRSFGTLGHIVGLFICSGCSLSHQTPGADGGNQTDSSVDTSVDTATEVRPCEGDGCATCEPMAASGRRCLDVPARSLGFVWDGEACRDLVANSCEGADCSRLYPSLTACQTAHSRCEPIVCATTGGVWSELALSCRPWDCGVANTPERGLGDCRGIPTAHCQCPPWHSFNSAAGCQPDADCTAEVEGISEPRLVNGCLASGGRWREDTCGDYRCGQATACTAVIPGCDCGPAQVFNRGSGLCEPSTECLRDDGGATLCRWSGGNWGGTTCGHSECGRLSPLDCATPSCLCAPHQIFDPRLGCLWSPTCRVASTGWAIDQYQKCDFVSREVNGICELDCP